MTRSRLLVAGSLNMDFVVRVAELPAPGQTVLGRGFVMVPGGKGANQAAAAGRLGAGRIAVQMAGRVGLDLFADSLKASLAANSVDVSTVNASRQDPTGTAFIWVDQSGQNSIVVAAGANGRFTAADIPPLRPALQRSAWALVQLETPLDAVTSFLHLARESGAKTMLDPAPAQRLAGAILSNVDLLTPNETEACLLLDRPATRVTPDDAPALAKALLQLGPRAVVLKLGDQGCYYCDAQTSFHVPAFRVNAVDTTAAGDTFNAALAVALTEGQELTEALRFANAAAALSVTRAGAQSSIPTRQEVDALTGGGTA